MHKASILALIGEVRVKMVESTKDISCDIKGDMTCADYGKSLVRPGRTNFLRRLLKAMTNDRT